MANFTIQILKSIITIYTVIALTELLLSLIIINDAAREIHSIKLCDDNQIIIFSKLYQIFSNY